MAQVYDVKVRYMRRIQMREYEPAESEVTVSAQLSDNENFMSVGQELILNARALVKSAITGKPVEVSDNKNVGKTETKVTKKTAVDEIPEDIRHRVDAIESLAEIEKMAEKDNKKAAATEKRKLAAAERKAKKLAEKEAAAEEVKKKAAVDEIPGDDEIPSDGENDDTSTGNMTTIELQEFINSVVTQRKVKPKQIKAILAEYNASRISEVPKANCGDVKQAIEKLIG